MRNLSANQVLEASGEVHNFTKTTDTSNMQGSEKSGQQSSETTPKEADKKYPTEQELAMTIKTVKIAFMTQFNIDKEHLAEPITYDINNDGYDEIILSTLKDNHFEENDYYVGIYDALEGTEILTQKLLSSDSTGGRNIELHTINNETFGKCLILINRYRDFGGTILALKNNELIEVGVVGGYYNEFEEQIVDSDNDGYHEIRALKMEYEIGSERLPMSDAVYDKVKFRWDKEEQEYMEVVYGEDGLTDDQRKPVGELTNEKALQILQVAYDVQVSWYEPLDKEEARKLLRPFFSNNFLYIFMNNGVVYDNGMIPRYSISDDYRFLLPAYAEDAPVDLEISSDGLTVYVSQDNEVSYEGVTYRVKMITTMIKTKYGWKIDTFEYKDI